MVRPEVIGKRLSKLEEYLRILGKLGCYSLDEFISEPERYGSAERFLQLAIEALTDMGNHVIADENLGSVDHAGDIPRLLAEHGYLEAVQRDKWTRMIGFRNILVHDYLDIDRRIVHAALQGDLGDINDLMRVFARLLSPGLSRPDPSLRDRVS